jgi:hypothetical protein
MGKLGRRGGSEGYKYLLNPNSPGTFFPAVVKVLVIFDEFTLSSNIYS